MLEIRRGRGNQSQDSPLIRTLHDLELEVLGITGIMLDRSKLPAGVFSKKIQQNGLAPPEKMKAVVAVFSNGEFCASSGLSHHLRKAPSQHNPAQSENLIAMWSKRSRTSKIRFEAHLDESASSSDPALFEVWVALTDGKGENKTCVSFPIGLGNLPVEGTQSKPVQLDLPVGGLSKKEDGSGSTGSTHELTELSGFTPSSEEKKEEEAQTQEPTVGSVYGLRSCGGSVLRLKVECKRKKPSKKDRRRSSKLSELKEADFQSNKINQSDDDAGSKMFRPIETSSLVSESAYSLGDVVSSRLPTRMMQKGNKSEFENLGLFGDFAGIDESQEMDFSDIGSKPSDRSGKPSLEYGPKSAFTAITPTKTLTPTCSTTTVGKSDSHEKTPSSQIGKLLTPDKAESPMDLGTLDPMQEEPSELGDSLRIYRKQIPAPPQESLVGDDDLIVPNLHPTVPNLMDDNERKKRSGNKSAMGSFDQVPLVIKTVSQIRGQKPSFPKPPRIDARSKAAVTVEEGSLVRSLVSTSLQKDDQTVCAPAGCGLFGTILQIPFSMMMQDAQEEKALRDYEDDHTWSTIDTRNSSQIVAWHDSVRAYAAESSSITGQNHGLFDQQCGATITSASRDRQCSFPKIKRPTTQHTSNSGKKQDELGWWNDIPGNDNGCM